MPTTVRTPGTQGTLVTAGMQAPSEGVGMSTTERQQHGSHQQLLGQGMFAATGRQSGTMSCPFKGTQA